MSDPVLTVSRMQAAEQALVDGGTSIDELMQRAGRGAAEWVWRIAAGRSVTVLCGPGNNGGDGYVIAEALQKRGLAVSLVSPMDPKTDAAKNARAAWRGAVQTNGAGLRGGVLVDCLFGSGLTRPLSSELASLLTGLAERHEATVAVDLPSGIDTDTGVLLGPVPSCALTVALGAWKPAHFLMPASARMGRTELVDIGIGPQTGGPVLFARPRLPAPPRDAHKYRRGLLAVVGGEMAGAAVLACEAAMRAGAGYVKLLSDHSHPAAPADLVVDDRPLAEALEDRRIDAVLVGPGLGRSDTARQRLSRALAADLPALLDADALAMLEPVMLKGRSAAILATPHEGELAMLCKAFDVQGEGKQERAAALAARSTMTILAKGPDNLLCTPGGRTAFFPPASSWLSAAGTGDVLAGVAAGRLAAGLDAWRAGGEAVWLHSEAARLSGTAFTASELARTVSAAYANLS